MKRFACWILGLDFFVRRIVLGPQTVLVLKCKQRIEPEGLRYLHELLERKLPSQKILVLDSSMSLEVIIDHGQPGILTQPGEKLP